MKHMLTIGDTAGAGYVDSSDALWVRDSRGRYYHNGWIVGSEIRVFGPDGAYLTMIGRRGRGPGEMEGRSPMHVGVGDTLHVFNNGSHIVFDPEHRLVRTNPVRAIPFSVFESPVGDLIVNARPRDPSSIGLPLHRYSRTGEHQASFGAADPYVGPRPNMLLRQLAGRAGGSTFFSVHFYRFAVEEWSVDGSLLRTLLGSPAWFAPLNPETGPSLPAGGEAPLPASIRAARLDDTGLLWLICNIPDRNWRDAFFVHGRMDVHGPEPDPHYLYDTMIVVIDMAREQILKRSRSDRRIGGFVGSDVFSMERTAGGHPQIMVWSIELIR